MMQYSTIPGIQGICAEGWHIPTDNEWKLLEGTVDSQYGVGDTIWDLEGDRGYDAGGKLKETGYSALGIIRIQVQQILQDLLHCQVEPGIQMEHFPFPISGRFWTST